MRRLLILNRKQFGYHIPTYKYTQYLSDYKLAYLCFDNDKKRIQDEKVEVIYVRHTGNKLTDGYRFFKTAFNEIQKYGADDVIFIVNFELCFLITFFNAAPRYILNIVTRAVLGSRIKRTILDWFTTLNTKFFDTTAVISDGVGRSLQLATYSVLPLGADQISDTNKEFTIPVVLYIGTLNNRNISKAVKGYCRFIKENPRFKDKSEFHVVGGGRKHEIRKLEKTINKYDTFSNIYYHGYKNHSEVRPLFDKCNIGLSFVPQTDYYDHQPSTKTFEYMLSGLVCIGTKTQQHAAAIDNRNGILCKDTAQGIYKSLSTFVTQENHYHSACIRQTAGKKRWMYVIQHSLNKEILKSY